MDILLSNNMNIKTLYNMNKLGRTKNEIIENFDKLKSHLIRKCPIFSDKLNIISIHKNILKCTFPYTNIHIHIGFCEGMCKASEIIGKRENIKLQESLKNYEHLLNGMYNAGTYAICGTTTAFTSIGIVALFPVSVPILLQYREK